MVKEIRVLVAHHGPAGIVSGAEYDIADMIRGKSDHVEYITLTPGKGRLADYYRSMGFAVWDRKLHTKRRKYPGLHAVQSFFFAKKLKRANIDVVLCNTFPAGSVVRTACRMASVPYVIHVREYISDRPLHRLLMRDAKMIFASSQDVLEYLKEFVEPSKIVVTYDHIDSGPILSRIARHRQSGTRILPFGTEFPVVGIVGRISSYKQQDLFIRASIHIHEQMPDVRFAVVGSATRAEKKYEESLKRIASERGMLEHISFMGHREDALEIISELTVCCLTSDREPFPRTVLEAQVIGCPIVAADTGGCPEMVEDQVTGLLFSAVSQDSDIQLATRVVQLLRDSRLRESLVKRAAENVMISLAGASPIRRYEHFLQVAAE